jgi:glucan phosphoethanolaminetransferase (alkaline phosphatase superfamily)
MSLRSTQTVDAFFSILLVVIFLAGPDLFMQFKLGNDLEVLIIFCQYISFYLIPLYFFRNSIHAYLWLLLPFILLSLTNIGCLFSFNEPFNTDTVGLILHTNRHEVTELLAKYVPLMIAGAIGFLFIAFLLLKVTSRSVAPVWATRISISASIIFLFIIFTENGKMAKKWEAKKDVYTIFPISFLMSYREVWKQDHRISEGKSDRNVFRFDSKMSTTADSSQIHILIIGETGRYDHWNINGYFRNTSPKLSLRTNLISYKHVYTEGFVTELSVPMILTGVGPEDYNQHYHQKGIVGLFREAGFSTYWLSNHVDFGHVDIHAQEAGYNFNLNDGIRNSKSYPLDLELLGKLDSILQDAAASRKFIVLWTKGSHYDYSSRYSNEYDLFRPSNKTFQSKPNDLSKKEYLVNSYDNSILYADVFIDSVINMVEKIKKPTTITYVSDHGEDLLDDDRRLTLHESPVPSSFEVHVPFFFWYSNEFQSAHPEYINRMTSLKDMTLTSGNIFHTLPSLAGILYAKKDKSKDMSSDGFQQHIPLVLVGHETSFRSDSLR